MPLIQGTGNAYPSALTNIGIALEATTGTPITPTHVIPVKGPKYKPDLMFIPDDTLQGSMVQTYDLVTGLRYDGHGWSGPPYLDSFPNFLCAEFGSVDTVTAAPASTTLNGNVAAGSTTAVVASMGSPPIIAGSWVTFGSASLGTLETHQVLSVSTDTLTLVEPMIFAQPTGGTVTGLTKHQFCLLNAGGRIGAQPPSMTLMDFNGEEWRQISAAQLDELTIKGNGTGLIDYTCTFFGNPAVEDATPPSLSANTIQTPAPWSFYCLIGPVGSSLATLASTGYNPSVTDWEFDFKRGVKPIPALTGQQAYFQYFANVLQNSGKMTFIEQSGSPQLNNFLTAQRLVFDFSIFDMKAGFAMNFHASNAEFKTGEIDRSKEWVDVPMEFELLPSTTDLLTGGSNTGVGPVIVTVANSTTTAYH
jgi:hypothetical protein